MLQPTVPLILELGRMSIFSTPYLLQNFFQRDHPKYQLHVNLHIVFNLMYLLVLRGTRVQRSELPKIHQDITLLHPNLSVRSPCFIYILHLFPAIP